MFRLMILKNNKNKQLDNLMMKNKKVRKKSKKKKNKKINK